MCSVALIMSPVEDDPFEAFGDDSDDDDAQEESASVEPARRDPSCGALVFHEGTVQAMLLHVHNEPQRSLTADNGNDMEYRRAMRSFLGPNYAGLRNS
jgi:hypothetical protein